MKKYLIVTAASLVLASLSGYADNCEAAKANWDKHCKKCHAEDGSADTALGKKLELKDYTDPAALAEMSDEDLFNATKDGVEGTKMKGYAKKLSDEEINALVAYMRAMAKS
ncbi:MAG: cytochrome c [Puniceicoccaceae bacterium]